LASSLAELRRLWVFVRILHSVLQRVPVEAEFVDQAQVDEESKLQLRFYARQFIDAMSPSNFPATNPEVIRTAIRTRSASLVAGMQNLIEDLQKGRITRVGESAFEVGRNLAVTPGSVVFENELIQLIQMRRRRPRSKKRRS
jgi:polyhydroxyalkanoate synthase